MLLPIRPAEPEDIAACIWLRAHTRENAVSAERLASLGITEASWSSDVASGRSLGFVAEDAGQLAGYCFGDAASGEILVLALLPAYEGQGIGRRLLLRTMAVLHEQGHRQLFLYCAADPTVRSHGFYRHLGWRGTGQIDGHGDERLVFASSLAEDDAQR